MRKILLIAVLTIGGCCWMSKRSCFPPCPPAEIVKIEKPCTLPPKLKLPAADRVPCPEQLKDGSCYDAENAAKLAQRLSMMRDWIKAVRSRCR